MSSGIPFEASYRPCCSTTLIWAAACRLHRAQEISNRLIAVGSSIGSLLLPDSDARVQDALSRLKSKAPSDADLKESLATGESWPKCFEKHQASRRRLSKIFSKKARQSELYFESSKLTVVCCMLHGAARCVSVDGRRYAVHGHES